MTYLQTRSELPQGATEAIVADSLQHNATMAAPAIVSRPSLHVRVDMQLLSDIRSVCEIF